MSFDDFQSIDLGVKKGLTYDEAIERAGGFGKQLLRCFILLHELIGLFHVYAILFFTLAMTTNGYLTYSIPFVQMKRQTVATKIDAKKMELHLLKSIGSHIDP